MSRNIIFVLMHHRHKLLDLIYLLRTKFREDQLDGSRVVGTRARGEADSRIFFYKFPLRMRHKQRSNWLSELPTSMTSDNIKMNHREVGWGGVDWIRLPPG
jgi:hypothetical protein